MENNTKTRRRKTTEKSHEEYQAKRSKQIEDDAVQNEEVPRILINNGVFSFNNKLIQCHSILTFNE